MIGPDRHEPPAIARRRRRAACWLAAVSMLGVAACGGDDSTAEDPDPTTAPTTAPPATTAATTSTSEPPVESTTSTTSTTTTTAAPTTTEDPAAAVAADVEAAFVDAWNLYDAALVEPDSAAAEAAAVDATMEPRKGRVVAAINEFRELGYSVVLSTANPSSIDIEKPAVMLDGSDTTAQLTACLVDTSMVVEVGAGPSGSNAIVDDTRIAVRLLAQLELVDDRWLLAAVSILGEWPGAAACVAQ